MESVWVWLAGNWLSALQAVGIVSGLFFTGLSFRQNIRVQKAQTLISITQQHRTIWLKVFDSPKLKRILDPSPRRQRPTDDEKLFVNLILLHLTSTLVAVRRGVLDKPAGMEADLREFLSLPIPRAVWEETIRYRDRKTVRYVEALLRRNEA